MKTLQSSQLGTLIEVFLSQSHLKAGTRKAYTQALQPMRDYIGPSRPISDIEPLELQRFWNRFTDPSKNYSPHYIRKHYRSLKTFFNWTVDMQLLKKTPFAGIKAPRVQKYSSRQKAMTDDEYHAILNHALYSSPRNYALIIFMGDTGCRAIGASRVKVGDINLEDRSALITGKGDKQRVVYFGEKCKHALKNWIRQKPTSSGEYLFRERPTQGPKRDVPLQPDNISQIIRRVGQSAGLERSLGSHSLRHRKGHQLADSGTPITVSAKALGHESTETTQIYYPDDDARVRAKMDELSTDNEDVTNAKPVRKIIPLHPRQKGS